MTRDEHLKWCKERALEYLDRGDLSNAVTSMLSDLEKHAETKAIAKSMASYGMFLLMYRRDTTAIRGFIKGFN